jgi:hypothetical protein
VRFATSTSVVLAQELHVAIRATDAAARGLLAAATSALGGEDRLESVRSAAAHVRGWPLAGHSGPISLIMRHAAVDRLGNMEDESGRRCLTPWSKIAI